MQGCVCVLVAGSEHGWLEGVEGKGGFVGMLGRGEGRGGIGLEGCSGRRGRENLWMAGRERRRVGKGVYKWKKKWRDRKNRWKEGKEDHVGCRGRERRREGGKCSTGRPSIAGARGGGRSRERGKTAGRGKRQADKTGRE